MLLTPDAACACRPFLANKLAKYQRGPHEALLLREWPENTGLCEPAAPLHDSGWFAEVIQLDIHREEYLEAAYPRPQQITKYMPLYYRHAAGHRKGEQDSELADKLQELQQQTLTMHNRWEEQQAATQAYARRPMKAGTPFTRPALTHPKLVGAAGTVPNNMLKHKWKPAKEPDLTRDPSGPNVLLVPSLVGNSLPEREKVRRRPPVAKLHCKAFQFPVLVSEQDGMANRNAVPTRVERHRDYQMLGSGFRIRRGNIQADLPQAQQHGNAKRF
ncbi:hypothetical protein ABBQ32_012053 [Trebouxia sp. C0010 RCD-2024]